MKITVDTKLDSKEQILKVINILNEAVNASKSLSSIESYDSSSDMSPAKSSAALSDESLADSSTIIDENLDADESSADNISACKDESANKKPANAFIDMFAPENSSSLPSSSCSSSSSARSSSFISSSSSDLSSSSSDSDIDPALLQKTLSEANITNRRNNGLKIKSVTDLDIKSNAAEKHDTNNNYDKDDDKDEDWGPRTKMTLADLERY